MVGTTPTDDSGRTTLDCRGLSCPIPIVRISRAMKAMTAGQILHVQATDRAFPADLNAWLSSRAEVLLSLESAAGEHVALIRKGGGAS